MRKLVIRLRIPVHVQTEHRLVMNPREKFLFIDELEMVPEPAIHLLTQYSCSRVTIQFIGMHECTYTIMFTCVIPSVWQEAAE